MELVYFFWMHLEEVELFLEQVHLFLDEDLRWTVRWNNLLTS